MTVRLKDFEFNELKLQNIAAGCIILSDEVVNLKFNLIRSDKLRDKLLAELKRSREEITKLHKKITKLKINYKDTRFEEKQVDNLFAKMDWLNDFIEPTPEELT